MSALINNAHHFFQIFPLVIPNNSFKKAFLTLLLHSNSVRKSTQPTRFCLKFVTGPQWDVQKSLMALLLGFKEQEVFACNFAQDNQEWRYSLLCPNITDTTIKCPQMWITVRKALLQSCLTLMLSTQQQKPKKVTVRASAHGGSEPIAGDEIIVSY